ncbi:methionine adenosyltransferase [Acholeplasma equirhinis]|uniref:methionine adenosyltransferase n=1 Tax=Acholeplasma equirhinis TaxID=555393 RepID=UPI00197A8C1E|nr:methionine adenosyltransferase [Acholeplasma equirhinis]MBN3490686.1 methionine adenosyltransferase [Acholeplasma equirhinis]
MSYIFSSESVGKGHPDKVSDYIADSILDYCLEADPNSRCAIETALANTTVYIFGEVTTKADLSKDKIIEIAKEAIKFCGYNDKRFVFEAESATYHVNLNTQSPDIAMGVDEKDDKEQGAGDQGIMFGYAKDDTESLMPLPIYLAHELTKRLAYVREQGIVKGLGPDCKSQVSVEYSDDHKPLSITAVVVSTQHYDEKSLAEVKKDVMEHVIKPVLPQELLRADTKYYINPTGRFVIGGPVGDSGLTGRKLIVDTYGGYSRHGGGAFSGKDASKVDRSASYMARYLAKQVVASGIAKTCEIQLAYAIGVAEPVALYVNTFGTAKISDSLIQERLQKNFKLTPKSIINKLGLKRPIFKQTVHFGHFGKQDEIFSWEQIDLIDIFSDLL